MLKRLGIGCNIAFPPGESGTNNCAQDTHVLINDPTMCYAAAELAKDAAGGNVNNTNTQFYIDQSTYSDHPKGCFKKDDGMFYYNGIVEPSTSSPLVGTPICREHEYENSTASSAGTQPDCQSGGFSIIKDELACMDAAHCMGAETDTELIDANEMDNAIFGCFWDPSTGKVHFNSKANPANSPADVIGLCNVTVNPR